MLHLRRADGVGLDDVLHVNLALQERALLAVFSPLERVVEDELEVPPHDSDLRQSASVHERDGSPADIALDARATARLPVRVPPRSATCSVFEVRCVGRASLRRRAPLPMSHASRTSAAGGPPLACPGRAPVAGRARRRQDERPKERDA